MAFTLEEIAADAKTCAEACWWQAHDEKDYVAASLNFLTAENVISKYSGNQVEPYDAMKYFSLALQNYDKFTEKLKGGNGTKELEQSILDSLVKVYNALSLNPSIAQCNANWWIYFARARMSDKKGDIINYNLHYAKLAQNLADEHKVRYDINNDDAHGLASLMLAAMHFGHNKSPKNWEKVIEYMDKYYCELFTILSERQGKTKYF